MKIDLRLPTSWGRCSLAQLRAISEIMIERSSAATPLVPFSMFDVKVAAFFRLANLEVAKSVDRTMSAERQYYLVRKRPFTLEEEARPLFFLKEWAYRMRLKAAQWRSGRYAQSFPIHVWQIQSWIAPVRVSRKEKEKVGVLDWMADDQRYDLLVFPMKTLRRRRRWWGMKVEFRGPSALMDGFTWQRYRHAQDYMQLFVRNHNRLIGLQQMGVKARRNDIVKAAQAVRQAKALFLATIFVREVAFMDERTKLVRRGFHYIHSHTDRNAAFFADFPDRDWQIVLLWWSSMMLYLSRTYRRVFKRQDVNEGGKRANPMEVYTRTTATMEKYLSMTAADVDNEPYNIILQQLEDIANQNAEMERISKQMKSRK